MKKGGKQITIDTAYGAFAVVLLREPDMGGYAVSVPKMRDVITWGKTREEAKRMAKEAIECSVEGEVILAAERAGTVTLRKTRTLDPRVHAVA